MKKKIVEKSRILENRARETIGPDVQEKNGDCGVRLVDSWNLIMIIYKKHTDRVGRRYINVASFPSSRLE